LPHNPNPEAAYFYEANDGDGGKTYGLMVVLEATKNDQLMVSDPGAYYDGVLNSKFYEVGSQPEYCSKKYSGQSSNWFHDSINVCQGGN
jgi:hypothetical protein